LIQATIGKLLPIALRSSEKI